MEKEISLRQAAKDFMRQYWNDIEGVGMKTDSHIMVYVKDKAAWDKAKLPMTYRGWPIQVDWQGIKILSWK